MTGRAAGTLARFAFESGRLTHSIAKPKLFEPNRALELSVFAVAGLDAEDIGKLGIGAAFRHATARRLYGWGELNEADVRDVGLSVVRDDAPPRHANVVGWPSERGARKLIMIEMARRSEAVRLARPVEIGERS